MTDYDLLIQKQQRNKTLGSIFGVGVGALATPILGPAAIPLGSTLGSFVGGRIGSDPKKALEEHRRRQRNKAEAVNSFYQDIAQQNQRINTF